MKGTKTRRLLLTLGIFVLVAAVGITAVFAQEGEDAPLPDSEGESPAPFGMFGHHFGGKRSFGFGGGRYGGALEGITPWGQGLADALDIPLEELEEAQAQAHANWIAEMVAAGYMEQEQADLMLAYNALKGNINRHALTAEALGISEDTLTAAREEGKTLAEMLEEAGLSVEELMGAMQEAYEAAVQAEVGESITQEQADMILENGTGFGMGHGFGGMRGFGGMHGFGKSQSPGGMHSFGMNHGLGTSSGLGNGFQGSCSGPALNGTGL